MKMTNKMQLRRIIYYSLAALHVSGDIFAHHQEHLNCITASGITHVCRCQPAATYVCNTYFISFVAEKLEKHEKNFSSKGTQRQNFYILERQI